MNQMNELNQAFEDYFLNSNNIQGLLNRQLKGIFVNFTGVEKVFKVGILSFICFVKINCVLLYLSNERRA